MKKARDVLQRLLTQRGISLEKYNSVFDHWTDIVGEKIGAESKIRDIVNNTLIVEVYHPGWKQLLTVKRKQIIGKINRNYPNINIKGMKVVVTTRKRENKRKAESVDKQSSTTASENIEKKKGGNKQEEGNELERALGKLKKAVEENASIDKEER